MVNLLRSLLRWTRALAAIYTSSSCNNVRSVMLFQVYPQIRYSTMFSHFASTYKSAHLIFYFYSTTPTGLRLVGNVPTFDEDKEARVRLEGSLSGLGIAVLGIW